MATSNWTTLEANANSGTTTYSHTGLAPGTTRHYRVSAINTNGAGTPSNVDDATTNNAPAFPGSTAARSVAENTAAGQDVGAVLTATDADSDTLTYTLEGADAAAFDIVTTSGSAQIRTKAGVTYDHEAKSTYTVIVKADDSKGGTATVTVTITLTDVNEPPGVPAAPSVTATPGSGTSLDVSWTAPANTGPAIASYDLQYREGASGSFTAGPQDVIGTSAAIASLAPSTSYEVQVRATNAEGDSDWSPSGPGQTNNSAGALEVPAGWSLTPTALAAGDQFRLVFLSSASRGPRDTAIAPLQHLHPKPRRGRPRRHPGLQRGLQGGRLHRRHRRPRQHLHHLHHDRQGRPHLLARRHQGRRRVRGFLRRFPGTTRANDKNESGTDGPDTSMTAGRPITGCKHDGTEKISGSSFALGSTDIVTIGRPNSFASGSGPLSSSSAVEPLATRPMYGLSALFQVAAAVVVNNPATGAPTITGTAQVGQALTAVTTAIMDDDGLTTPGYTYQWIRVATDTTETNIASAMASTYTLVTGRTWARRSR